MTQTDSNSIADAIKNNGAYDNEQNKCTEVARIKVPWAGVILNYCPFHAKEIVILAAAMGSPIRCEVMPLIHLMTCESNRELNELESKENKLISDLL